MICNGNPSLCSLSNRLVDGRWAGEAAWAQKGCLLPHTHTKHCWAHTRQGWGFFSPSAPGKDGDTQLRFTVTLLPALGLSWLGGGRAVGLGAPEGSRGFPRPSTRSLAGQPPEEPTDGGGRTSGTPRYMGPACVGEAALASRTVPAQGPGRLLSRKGGQASSPVVFNWFFPL